MQVHLRRPSTAVAVSLALHGAFATMVWSLPELPGPAVSSSAPFVFDLVGPSREDDVEPVSQVEPSRPEPHVAPAPRSAVRSRPVSAARASEGNAPAVEATTTGDVTGGPAMEMGAAEAAETTTAPISRSAMRTLLAPSSVARSAFVIEGPGPSRPSGPAGLDVGRLGPLTEAEAEAVHSDHLRDRALERSHLTREVFELQRQPDGSYRHEGHLFVGVVRRDGSVDFQVRDAASFDLTRGTGTFDLNDALMGAQGGNPRSAEEARFMRETESLRLQLEQEHHARELDVARRRLRGRLRTVWAAARSASARRARIFELWDAFPEDGSADALRAAVLTFVRIHLPAGATDAYAPEELAQLNAQRESRAAFAPY
ncbi:MAG: hypothetical protein AB8I08_29840 [Sandaracinaceae bacterium]